MPRNAQVQIKSIYLVWGGAPRGWRCACLLWHSCRSTGSSIAPGQSIRSVSCPGSVAVCEAGYSRVCIWTRSQGDQSDPVQTRSHGDSKQGAAPFSGQVKAALPQLHPMMFLPWQRWCWRSSFSGLHLCPSFTQCPNLVGCHLTNFCAVRPCKPWWGNTLPAPMVGGSPIPASTAL